MGVLVATLLLSGVALSAADGLFGKSLRFPSKTTDSYVTLTPLKPLDLEAFTLCMDVAMEQYSNRDVILFAYRTNDFDELNVWLLSTGNYSLYLQSNSDANRVEFDTPPPSTLKTKLCITWESTTGLSAFWVDGNQSVKKVHKMGHRIQPNGTVILGQDLDGPERIFDDGQSFVGEISDVNMWDYVLTGTQIKALHSCSARVPKGNIFDWYTIQYQIHGSIIVVPDKPYNVNVTAKLSAAT